MSRTPFDPMQSAAMKAAKKSRAGGESPPLSPEQERALIEAHAAGIPPLTENSAGSPDRPLTISQTNTLLSHALTATLPPVFFVQGEISNFRTYDRGHAFFTLKDASAELPCILWKDALARLKFRPKDGLAVIARGNVRLYEPQGKIQLYVETLFPQGAGALELAFRQLCDKLRTEGLFEQARKRPLPRLPQHIAIITSRTGDVLHDVLTTAWRRYPGLRISLYPARVQGEQAAPDIIRAIQKLNAHHLETRDSKLETPLDLILLVRGGGSLEDLWAFNDERLARAIIASKIPIATGIGHEPDTTIADLVGDLRGPTPTGITELTIPDTRALSAELQSAAAILTRNMHRLVTHAQTRLDRTAVTLRSVHADALRTRRYQLDQITRKIAGIEPRHAIAQGWRRVEDAQSRLHQTARRQITKKSDVLLAITHRLDRASPVTKLPRHHDRLNHLQSRLAAALRSRLTTASRHLAATAAQLRVVSPQGVLDRGYSITTDKQGNILRSASQVQRGDVISTKLAEGEITSTIGKPKQGNLF